MAKVKIEVLDATINGLSKGEQLEVERKEADHLIEIGYAKEVAEKAAPKAKKETKESK